MKHSVAAPAAYLATRRGWADHGNCLEFGTAFLDDLGTDDAVEICWSCPVQRACLAHAITTRATDVVQGGIAIGSLPLHPTTWSQT